MLDELFEKLPISRKQLKVFFSTFIAVFLMMSLHYLGVRAPVKIPKLVVPVPQQGDIMDSLRPKLEQKNPKFELKKESQIIVQTYAADDSEVEKAAAYAVIDLDTGEVLAEKNGSKQLPVASLTKIMTAVVALDLASPSELFPVTEYAVNMIPTKLAMTLGEKMSLEELLNASLLTSANDAVQVIRDGINVKYEHDVFVRSMNEKASFLGLENTHFTNPQGFDYGNNYSSIEDMAKLTHYALTNYPLIADIVKKDYQFLSADAHHKEHDLYNWNGLIGVYPEVQGVKIGNTAAAGKTTIVVSAREGKRLLAIVLGAPGILERDLWAAELLDLGYEKTLGLAPVHVTEEQLYEKYGTWNY